MHLKLKRIAPLQAGKILAAIYGLLSLLFVPFFLFMTAMSAFAAKHGGGAGAPPVPVFFGMGAMFIILIPVIYTLMGFIGGVLGAAVYNLMAKWLGGFELEFEPARPEPPKL